jgi:hypothetical protein
MVECLYHSWWYIPEIQQQVDGGASERELGGSLGLH